MRYGLFGFWTETDKRRLRGRCRHTIRDCLDRSEPLSRQSDVALGRAVELLEEEEPRLVVATQAVERAPSFHEPAIHLAHG